jgi:hypothetical protein
MFYITSDKVNLWYPVKANTIIGAKRSASAMFNSFNSNVIKIGKDTACGIQCIAVKSDNTKWVNLI